MTEQVKRFRADLCVQPIEVVAATHYDALHQQVEGLRAENERLSTKLRTSLLNESQLRAELEEARGLLGEAVPHIQARRGRPEGASYDGLLKRIDAFLTTTPAPEVRCQTCDGTGDVHRADGEWLGECHCVKAEQEVQVIGRVHHNPDHAEPVRAVLNSIGRHLPDNAPLFATPQPAPDVSALVEALEAIANSALSIGVERRAIHLAATNALATYRKQAE